MSHLQANARAVSGGWPTWRHSCAYVAAVLLLNLLIVANPGFRAADEWHVFDQIEREGLLEFVRGRAELRPGEHLGVPIAPVGFIPLGMTAPFMISLPLLPHLFDVLLHAVIGVLLAATLLRLGMSRRLAWLAAMLLAVSPLATFSTAWTAASFDRWATLFMLSAILVMVEVNRRGLQPSDFLYIVGIAGLAILSKLTALVFPMALLAGAAAIRLREPGGQLRFRTAMALSLTSTIPLLAYMWIRLPALQGSLTGESNATYTASLSYIPQNVFVAIAYPFMPDLIEPHTISHFSVLVVAASVALHIGLVILIWRSFGVAATALYGVSYFIYLLPVLPLPNLAGQYFYGAAIAVSVALAGIWVKSRATRRSWAHVFVAGLILVAFVHHAAIQRHMYASGVCQSRFMASIDAVIRYDVAARLRGVHVVIAPGAPAAVARRALSLQRYSAELGAHVSMEPIPNAVEITMARDCSLDRGEVGVR